jgi:hypothetical protein
MKLFEAFQHPGFHTAVMTTFGVEFDAFESIALSRMRGAECRNVMLVCDAGMLGLALADAERPPKFAGTGYLVAKARASGVFHPKIVVQIGKDRGRLIVASANATAPGLAGNLEIAATVECGTQDTGERKLVLAGWKYALRFLDERQNAVEDKLRWARERSRWLDPDDAADGVVDLADGSQAAFLASGGEDGIARQFVDLVGDRRPVERLVVMSPYWDEGLAGLEGLQSSLRPRKTVLLVDTERRLFPVSALPRDSKIQISELRGFDKKNFTTGNTRFIHAKMIVATVAGIDHVLVGSANCSFAALGDLQRPGLNEEACLYRRLPAGRLFEVLGLKSLLATAVDVQKIPKPAAQNELPLSEAVESDPGTFEVSFDRLTWWPRSAALGDAVATGQSRLELLDPAGKLSSVKTDLLAGHGPHRTFHLADVETRPAFARIRRADGSLSGLAIIACVEDLRAQTRDPLTAKAERAIRELEFDDDEGLWLLDAIHTLAMPKAGPAQVPRAARPRDKKTAPAVPGDLDYEAFMRGRRREFGKTEGERNSLAGNNVSYVRAALNRMLGVTETPPKGPASDDDERAAASALDTGDEAGSKEDAVDRGFDPQDPQQSAKAAADLARWRRENDAYAIACAVDDYTERLRQPDHDLDSVDLLHLRALLMIIGVAARPPGVGHAAQLAQMQVLPCSDDQHGDTWPRLMGRVLAAVFGGPSPALKRLQFDRSHDRIPDDLLETWACCIWFSLAIATAAKADPGCAMLIPYVVKLAEKVRALLPLSKDEMASPSFYVVLDRLDQRLGSRLKVGELKQKCLGKEQVLESGSHRVSVSGAVDAKTSTTAAASAGPASAGEPR